MSNPDIEFSDKPSWEHGKKNGVHAIFLPRSFAMQNFIVVWKQRHPRTYGSMSLKQGVL